MSARTRTSLISDVFSLTEANYFKSQTMAFELATYLTNEFDYLPWNTFISRIKFFTDLFDSMSNYAKLQTYLADLVKPYYEMLGWIENVNNDLWTDRLTFNLFW